MVSLTRAVIVLLVLLLGPFALLGPQGAAAQVPQQFVNAPVSSTNDMHPTDVDGDGKTDLVVASETDVNLAWFKNEGNGSFAYRTIPLARGTFSVHAADLDGDSVDEVVAGNSGTFETPNTIVWHERDGSGSFVRDTITANIETPVDLDTADLDDDERTDVLAAAQSFNESTITWYQNGGGGAFTKDTVMTTSELARGVSAANVDGDDDVDVVSAAGSVVAWHENDGSGAFSAPDTIYAEEAVEDLHTTDVDGDGDVDVLVAPDNDSVIWYENDGSGNFTAHSLSVGGNTFRSISGGDVNGDGHTDIITNAQQFSGDLVVFLNNGEGSFGSSSTISVQEVDGVSAANFDGDSSFEVVFRGPAKVGWHDQPDDQTRVVSSSAISVAGLDAADVDDDGATDVLSVSGVPDVGSNSQVAWHENDGSENFTTRTISTSLGNVQSISATDLNEDGSNDILIGGSATDSTLVWFENDGDETFTPTPIEEETEYTSIVPVNLDDEDGTDILAATDIISETEGINWYENDGSTSFTKHTVGSNKANSVYATDLDGDGDTDVVASIFEEGLSWYENDGGSTPSFTEHTITTAPELPASVEATDVDGDGDTDVLLSTGDVGDDTILWYENDGSESFTAHSIATSIDFADVSDLHVSDVNGDNVPDIVAASSFHNKVNWYRNDGSGSFTGQTVTTRVSFPRSVLATDVNGDGMTDVLSGSKDDNKIAWYENTDGNLPVELVGLTAEANGPEAVLSWTTASETNNAGFAVQHSAPNEETWTQRGFVESTAPGGTTSDAQSYRFTAEHLAVGTHQFRLKQIDLDGTAHVSKTVTAEIGLDQPVRLTAPAPNPVQQQATLSFAVKEAQETTLRLYNVLGQRVATLYRGTPTAEELQTLDLSASDLPSGVYFLRLQAGGQTRTQKLTVVR